MTTELGGLDLTGVDLVTEVVRTDRLVLRPHRPDDVDAVHRASQDAESQRWISAIPVPYTREDARRFVEDVAMRERSDGLALPVVVEADGEYAGSGGIRLRPGRLGPEIGLLDRPLGARPGLCHRDGAGPRGLGLHARGPAGAPLRGRAERGLSGRGTESGFHAGGCGARVPDVPGRHPRRRRVVRPLGRGVSGAGGQ
jgi:hypothetical protein